jgi:tRNA threonylcarbamoyladenosine biosynthesis protein TsaE
MPPPMPILDDRSLEFLSHSPDQTRRLGIRLGERLDAGQVVGLAGALGSGKTTLAQGIALGWGALEAITSPSFVLVHEYRRADSTILYHVDAYRLSGPVEAEGMGLGEMLAGDCPLILEWPERVAALLPEERLTVALEWVDDSRRRLRFEAQGPAYVQLLREYRKTAFGG